MRFGLLRKLKRLAVIGFLKGVRVTGKRASAPMREVGLREVGATLRMLECKLEPIGVSGDGSSSPSPYMYPRYTLLRSLQYVLRCEFQIPTPMS